MYNIGQISELTGYSQRMIRYFEELGLIRPSRSDSGYRKFANDDVAVVLKIRRLRELGFSYQEIHGLLNLDEERFQAHAITLLERHHQAADTLLEKIQRLEKICHGEVKTESLANPGQRISTMSFPQRTAYKIKVLDAVSDFFQVTAQADKSEIIYWKLNDFIDNCDLTFTGFDLCEVFSQSALVAILEGGVRLPSYIEAWDKAGYCMDVTHKGKFAQEELREFFGQHDIVIDHRFLDVDGKVLFRVLLPYQAFFLKTVVNQH